MLTKERDINKATQVSSGPKPTENRIAHIPTVKESNKEKDINKATQASSGPKPTESRIAHIPTVNESNKERDINKATQVSSGAKPTENRIAHIPTVNESNKERNISNATQVSSVPKPTKNPIGQIPTTQVLSGRAPTENRTLQIPTVNESNKERNLNKVSQVSSKPVHVLERSKVAEVNKKAKDSLPTIFIDLTDEDHPPKLISPTTALQAIKSVQKGDSSNQEPILSDRTVVPVQRSSECFAGGEFMKN